MLFGIVKRVGMRGIIILSSGLVQITLQAATAPVPPASATTTPPAPRKYVVSSDEIVNAAYKLVHDAGLNASVVDDLVVAALAAAAIDRTATNRYHIRSLEIKLPDGCTKRCQRYSFLYEGQRYYYDSDHLSLRDWYAADVATHTLTIQVAALSAARAAHETASVIVRRDSDTTERVSYDAQVLRLACQHYFHQGCLLTHHAYQGVAGIKPTCPIDRGEIDFAHAVTMAKISLSRGEAVPACSICLTELPSRRSRFGVRFTRESKVAKRAAGDTAGSSARASVLSGVPPLLSAALDRR